MTSFRFDMRPELIGDFLDGRQHGGVMSSALDAVGGLALMVAIGEKHPHESTDEVLHRFVTMGTVDLRADRLRPGIGRHCIAPSEVTRLGGRVGSTPMHLVNNEGTLIATRAGDYRVA